MEETELGKFVEAESSAPTRWYWYVGIVAFVLAGLAFKIWVYSSRPDWLVRVLGFLGF